MGSGSELSLLLGLEILNRILTAGVAITAFSLLLYALTFNLRDRVARSFALILICVAVVFTTEALQNETIPPATIDLLLRLQWPGLIFLPPAYLHLSDALLATTGRPSRGRRRWGVRLTYLLSLFFLFLLLTQRLLGAAVLDRPPAPYLQRTAWTHVFTFYYIVVIGWAWINFGRAYRRVLTSSGRRRMIYLMAGATAPALGSFPYLIYGASLIGAHALLFWIASILSALLVGTLLVVMAYAVAFFGVSWPDRVIKARLFKWLLRGPLTASFALGLMTVVRRLGELFWNTPYSGFVPLSVVISILILEHGITLLSPLWERWLFFGADRRELSLFQSLEERFLTEGDLQQFLESILAAARDYLHAPSAFVAILEGTEVKKLLFSGQESLPQAESLDQALQAIQRANGSRFGVLWDGYLLLPLYPVRWQEKPRPDLLLGLLGIAHSPERTLEQEQWESLQLLAERAALAIEDRLIQERLWRVLSRLQPQMDILQRLRAAARYESAQSVLSPALPPEADLIQWVKEALDHYWGGPKLQNNPLLHLRAVQQALPEHEGNATNALRTLLRRAIETTRPPGERRFTTEWLLYNILEMKFIEGRKVREVAARLALSEADLYRKQRLAIAAVARAILKMELETLAREEIGEIQEESGSG